MANTPSKTPSTMLPKPSELEGLSATPQGRLQLRDLFIDPEGVFDLSSRSPRYNALRLHHLYRGEVLVVNGKKALYGEGKEGTSYYYETDQAREKRVRIYKGDKVLPVVEVAYASEFLELPRVVGARVARLLTRRKQE